MYLSYTGIRNAYNEEVSQGSLTSAQLLIGDRRINVALGTIYRAHAWPFLERTGTAALVGSTQYYSIPANVGKYYGVTVTVGSRTYTPKEVISRTEWNILNETAYYADIPEYFFRDQGRVGILPIPSSSSNYLTHLYRVKTKDLSAADYTTGAITTLASGSTLVTGSATVWGSTMIGRWLRITESDSSAYTGDHEWYEIASVGSQTSLRLVNTYQGNSIASSNAAYTIGQMSLLPGDYHELPLYAACEIYFASIDEKRAEYYRKLKQDLMGQLEADQGAKSDGVVLEDTIIDRDNPNHYISY